jgi:hypothetical protein
MARRLDTFPVPKGNARYPWGDWLNGDPWELRKGEDYTAQSSTLRANAATQARRRGGRVRTRLLTDGGVERVVVQFVR